MAPVYDIVVIGDFDYNKKFKKNNVKMLMYDSRSTARICEIEGAYGAFEENLIPDYLDYDFVSDLL
jgi:ribosomal protein L2